MPFQIPKLADILPKVLAIVLYGDSRMVSWGSIAPRLSELQNRLLENCSKGDNKCDSSGKCFVNHLDYVKQP
jgi:hypothetical protein